MTPDPITSTQATAAPSAPITSPASATRILILLLFALALAATPTFYYFHSRTPPPDAPLAIGTLAPDFSLHDSQKPDSAAPITLSHLTQNGPVVVIFNMGLHCPACAQDISVYATQFDDFKKAGIQVVAVSHESPADTREELTTSGPIPFPLLFDPDNRIAKTFGLESPDGTVDERTFLIDKNRRILWSLKPDEPGGQIPHLLDLGKKSQSAH